MHIDEERHGDVLILRPVGRIDSATARAFEARLLDAVEPGPSRLVVDLGALTLMTEAGLRALLTAARRAKPAGSRVVLAAPPPAARARLAASGLSSLFECHDSVPAAVAALS